MDHTTMSMPMAMAPVSDAAAATTTTTMGSHSEAASSMGSSSAMMAMTFFQARGTPLFAPGWAPRSGAAYAATCLFLVALGVVLRCLLALRPLLEDLVWRAPPPPPSLHDPAATEEEEADDYEYDEDAEAEDQKHPVDCEILVPSGGGGKPGSRRPGAHARHRLHRAAGRHPPSAARALWTEIRRRGRASRVGVSAGRAAVELLLAVVGYLLMLAVMTMNLGYFASVLAGVFLGTFVLGDLATSSSLYQDHHC